jgi:hypothetical protein
VIIGKKGLRGSLMVRAKLKSKRDITIFCEHFKEYTFKPKINPTSRILEKKNLDKML